MEKKLLYKHLQDPSFEVLEHNKYVKNAYYESDIVDNMSDDFTDMYNALNFILGDNMINSTTKALRKGYIKKLKKFRDDLRKVIFLDVKDFTDDE